MRGGDASEWGVNQPAPTGGSQLNDGCRDRQAGERIGHRISNESRFSLYPADQPTGSGCIVTETNPMRVGLRSSVTSDGHPYAWPVAGDRTGINSELLKYARS